jgi:hypothetical protein
MKEFLYALLIIIVVAIIIAVDFLLTAGIIAILAWAFDFDFSWKLTIGIWVASAAIKLFLRGIFAMNKED